MKIKQTIRQYIAVFIYISVISTIFAAALISMSRINNIQEIIQKSFKSSNHAKEFIEFFKNTANFNISYLFYENGAIKLELFEMSLGINERMKFFDFYNDYLSTLENKTPEMNKFIEKFLEAKITIGMCY